MKYERISQSSIFNLKMYEMLPDVFPENKDRYFLKTINKNNNQWSTKLKLDKEP